MSGTSERTIKAMVVAQTGKTVETFRFCPSPAGPGTGRAAAWMRKNLPVAEVMSEAEAALRDGRRLVVSGCTINDLYTVPAVAAEPAKAEPKPEPKPDLDAMDLPALRELAEKRGIAWKKQHNAKTLRKMLAE